MAISTTGGYPQYSGAPSRFIPEIWSSKLLVKWYAACVAAAISNTDYEGDIKDVGDKVWIRTRGDVTIRDYTKGSTLVPQYVESPAIEFPIERAKYFFCSIDDIDKYQSDVRLLDEWSTDAGYQMKIEIDTEFLADVYSDADSDNKGATAGAKSGDINLGAAGSPLAVTKATVLDLIVDLDTVLDEQDVPPEDRWLVVPPWFRGMIMKSDLKDASLSGDGQSILRNGRIGRIGYFTIYISNLLTSGTDTYTVWHCMAGHKRAITFAGQITKTEHLERLENTFGQAIRGLNVFDWKVLKGEGLCDVYCYKSTV